MIDGKLAIEENDQVIVGELDAGFDGSRRAEEELVVDPIEALGCGVLRVLAVIGIFDHVLPNLGEELLEIHTGLPETPYEGLCVRRESAILATARIQTGESRKGLHDTFSSGLRLGPALLTFFDTCLGTTGIQNHQLDLTGRSTGQGVQNFLQ